MSSKLAHYCPTGTFLPESFINLRRDYQKKSNERRDYESVDKKSLS